jgi:hypothetical protein
MPRYARKIPLPKAVSSQRRGEKISVLGKITA